MEIFFHRQMKVPVCGGLVLGLFLDIYWFRLFLEPLCAPHNSSDYSPLCCGTEKAWIRPGNHLEERLLDQAQARASYTPLFWGHSRSIPQGMILDVQPLVKSLFCPIRASPNGFFDFEASTP